MRWIVFLFGTLFTAAGLPGCNSSTRSAIPTDHPSHPAYAPVSLKPTEGMWLPDALPIQRLKDEFGFNPTTQWAEHLRLSSVGIGASASFVSADGLVLTNHHVAATRLHGVSTPLHDYIAHGFLARTLADEIPLPGTELSVLESIENVTDRVKRAVDPKLPADQAVKARRAVFAQIERESQQKTGLQSHVITLYGGALYHLYRYKRYADVRIVFAPEASAGFFGGDPDNFEYPRYDLDVALLRAYEHGKPARIDSYLKLSTQGVREGDLVFVSGDPGHTDRLLPVSALETMRDLGLPLRIEGLEREAKALREHASRGAEQERQAHQEIFSTENSLKAIRPRLVALRGDLFRQKQAEEKTFRATLQRRADLRAHESAYARFADAEDHARGLLKPYYFVEQHHAFATRLFSYARDLVRLAAEDARPDDQRLPEYTQSRRQSLEHQLFAERPIYPDMEVATLAESLRFFRETMGADSDLVKKVLAERTPEFRADELVRGTRLGSAAERRRIHDGGAGAITGSADTMIQFARLIDDDSRRLRQAMESQVEEPETEAMAQINRARFAVFGDSICPDATGTLRLAFGVVKGYEQDGLTIPAWTTFAGAFEHEREHGAKPPFALPDSWHQAKDRIGLQTPLDFVCTADIIGGNSGSPVVNRAGELVGVIFDGNRQGLVDDFAYGDAQARALAVDSRAIVEALRSIYHADALAAELSSGHAPQPENEASAVQADAKLPAADPPNQAYALDLSRTDVGHLPDDVMVLDGDFAVREFEGRKCMELAGDPVGTFGALFGPQTTAVEVKGRICSKSRGKRFPEFGIGANDAGGYRLILAPGRNVLELRKADDTKASCPIKWSSGSWIWLRLRVEPKDKSTWRIQGKVWPDGQKEPKEWMLSADDTEAPSRGRSSIWGEAFSEEPIRYEELSAAPLP